MRLTFNRIATVFVILAKIKELKLGFPVDHWCDRNMKRLYDDYVTFLKKRDEINEKYCFKDEDGQYCKLIDGNIIFNIKEDCDVAEFDKEMNALMELESDFTPFVLSENVWETLPNFQVEGFSSDAIDFLLP